MVLTSKQPAHVQLSSSNYAAHTQNLLIDLPRNWKPLQQVEH